MPLNWSMQRKWSVAILLSLMTFMTTLSSSMLSPAIESISNEFDNANTIVAALPASIYLLGYAIGPLLLAGLSELYGRHYVLTCSNLFFCVWHIGCALAPSLAALIAFRFLAGVGGSAVMTLGGGSISDCFRVSERGRALAAWAVGLIVGPAIGPVVGAFVAETVGWRWGPWIVLIPSGIVAVSMALLCPESNHRVLIQRRVVSLKRELGQSHLRSCYDAADEEPAHRRILAKSMARPFIMMALSPIVIALSTHVAFLYGTLYLLFNSVSTVFRGQYNWSLGVSGLAYVPMGLGFASGLVLFATLSDKTIERLTKQRKGEFQPEMRLVDCLWYSCAMPISFFWYGWSASFKTHWIVPLIGLFPFGIGLVGIWQPYQAYLIDSFGSQYAASALAAFAVLRSVVATFLPLAGPSLYGALGLGWGSSVLGFVTLAMVPIPLFIERHGRWLRGKYSLRS